MSHNVNVVISPRTLITRNQQFFVSDTCVVAKGNITPASNLIKKKETFTSTSGHLVFSYKSMQEISK